MIVEPALVDSIPILFLFLFFSHSVFDKAEARLYSLSCIP